MLNKNWAQQWALEWIDAFNSHDLDRIFALYDDDFEMHSPYIIERMSELSGQLIGKKAVAPYWQQSLALQPPIQFELIDVFVGVAQLSVVYRSIGRKVVCESFRFNADGKVIWGCSQHSLGQ